MENNENASAGSSGGSGGPRAMHYAGIAVTLVAYLIYNHFTSKTVPIASADKPAVAQYAPNVEHDAEGLRSGRSEKRRERELNDNTRQHEDATRESGNKRHPDSESNPAASQAGGPLRDLDEDQRRHGHTLTKHVGRTDEQLLERLQQETDISSASTYTDKETAERSVGAAIAKNESKIKAWLERGGSQKLVLDYFGDAQHAIGRTVHRDKTSHPCFNAKVVLAMDNHGGGYFVLTSYPEAR